MYADETGNLAYEGAGQNGNPAYFGIGTVVFEADHGEALFRGLRLRVDVAQSDSHFAKGFHAVNDSTETRTAMFDLISDLAPRFDTTFLYKPNAYQGVRERGEMWLYQYAWELHFKTISQQVTKVGDRLVVIVASFGTRKRAAAARKAWEQVCSEFAPNQREIVFRSWDAPSSFGIQVADYGLWAVQRQLERGNCHWYEQAVKPTLQSCFRPWGPWQ
ncbi:hypothetical protein SAMN05421805_104179 [Saccharopolyspora antimicrobica]|uniref:DUF3800 domain-containing protein n=2 Tax=Saccharopolyspora antimicrobica TaxID=455193 RepID=A0A1I4YJT5_9PSEU|nr:hypothetical protein ATL45_0963 [Saccharopolyspora antimicrobica]SFN38341.1 hypothetical protein SAMN05421805_104179 [Saccharopolyspora antimicrobica]